ncbi:MAG: NADH-quinone oxidoreductase subunit C [Candidatus Altiarchaeota archaeon]|nr:NADH-quinone oxidoreductase subunit C [Candidatus Altiarchaeota archaeon]
MKELADFKEKEARLITISFDGEKLYYHFYLNGRIETLERPKLNAKSACKLFPNAEFYEREIAEKHKVNFRGHPKPKKLFT